MDGSDNAVLSTQPDNISLIDSQKAEQLAKIKSMREQLQKLKVIQPALRELTTLSKTGINR